MRIELGAAFADRDGDGVPDVVEELLGTDATKADSDGDGRNDGVDPAPSAATAADTSLAQVLAETLRYLGLAQYRRPIVILYAERRFWFDHHDVAPVVLHREPPYIGPRETMWSDGEVLRVHLSEVRASDDSASVKMEFCMTCPTSTFELKRVGDRWRVVDADIVAADIGAIGIGPCSR
jgi:hypothetical protein